MFKKYKNKPKTIEAMQFTEEYKDRCLNALTGQHSPDIEMGRPIIKVTTIHGEIAIVRIGDWIVKEEKLGFYYPIKDYLFKEGYTK